VSKLAGKNTFHFGLGIINEEKKFYNINFWRGQRPKLMKKSSQSKKN
jgi:hypothetical protein